MVFQAHFSEGKTASVFYFLNIIQAIKQIKWVSLEEGIAS